MQTFGNPLIWLSILVTVFLCGCGGYDKNTNNQSVANSPSAVSQGSDTPNTNVEDLALIVTLPFEAEDVVWKVDGTRKKVVAVIRFSKDNANKVVADAEKYGASVSGSIAVETWFPDELSAQSEMSGDNTVKGISYPANSFYQEPYTTGWITRVEGGDSFVLELTSK